MSKKEIEENLEEIIKRHRNGISIEELLHLMNDATPKRTLQYRLSTLVKSGILKIEGAGRNSKYYVNQPLEKTEAIQTTFKIPLSLEGEEVRKQISAPIQLRQHVSYRREFLDSYEPNKTFYLP